VKSSLYILVGIFFLALNLNTAFSEELSIANWKTSQGNESATKFSSLSQIKKSNIKNLGLAWTFHSGINDPSETTPIFNGVYLFTASQNFVFAINPSTGEEVWRTKFDSPVARRGLVIFANKIFVPSASGVYSLNPDNGKILSHYGNESSYIPPVFNGSEMYVGNYLSVDSFDIVSNKKLWSLSLTKNFEKNEIYPDSVVARLWSGMTFDKETNLIFIVTSNTGWLADGDIEDGGFCNSVIAIDAKNGKIVWQFQEIKHDLWDLDVVGHPIITKLNFNGKLIQVVIAVTKSGNTLILDRKTGKLIYGSKEVPIPKYHNESKFTSDNQIQIVKPKPFSSLIFDLNQDITDISDKKKSYVEFKLRHAKSEIFRPVSTENDVVLFGLHGGAGWPGAALDPKSSTLIVPSNKYPWILRSYPYAKDEKKIVRLSRKNFSYSGKCAACHGNDLRGGFLWESYNDLYFPSLVNISKRETKSSLTSLENFKKNHFYVSQIKKTDQLQPNGDGLKRIFEMVNNDKTEPNLFSNLFSEKRKKKIVEKFPNLEKIIYGKNIDYTSKNYDELISSVSQKDLNSTFDLFRLIQESIIDKGEFDIKSYWQFVLDQDGLPGSKPPWGYITSINLNSGNINWQVPFGEVYDKESNRVFMGDMNHGGVMITGSRLIFANGTRDAKARAFDLDDGKEIWKAELPAAGSSPPMSFYFKGCQYVVFTATGGIFLGYDKKSDTTIAFKLEDCK